ncbi:MAG: cupin domain-containing protein [Proteobacteria bacterium]|nr:cupin domain-containing protein [Pseudomonadota bacterium]
MQGGGEDRVLGESQLLFLANAFAGRLASDKGAELILLEVPNAGQFDPESESGLPGVQSIDLGLEPMLQSEHDERTRIYVATPKLFGTRALIGELVAFPPGTVSQNHHHVGAEHFQYVLRGEATVYLNETPQRLEAGDLLYKYDRERHYCENDGSGELVFVEFFVPGEYETVWADPERQCAWSPTGKNALGGEPSRHIATHTSDGSYHQDV